MPNINNQFNSAFLPTANMGTFNPIASMNNPTTISTVPDVYGGQQSRGMHYAAADNPLFSPFRSERPSDVLGANPLLAFLINGSPRDTRIGIDSDMSARLIFWLSSPYAKNAGASIGSMLRQYFVSLMYAPTTDLITGNGKVSGISNRPATSNPFAAAMDKASTASNFSYMKRILLNISFAITQLREALTAGKLFNDPKISKEAREMLTAQMKRELELLDPELEGIKEMIERHEKGAMAMTNTIADGTLENMNKGMLDIAKSLSGGKGGDKGMG